MGSGLASVSLYFSASFFFYPEKDLVPSGLNTPGSLCPLSASPRTCPVLLDSR